MKTYLERGLAVALLGDRLPAVLELDDHDRRSRRTRSRRRRRRAAKIGHWRLWISWAFGPAGSQVSWGASWAQPATSRPSAATAPTRADFIFMKVLRGLSELIFERELLTGPPSRSSALSTPGTKKRYPSSWAALGMPMVRVRSCWPSCSTQGGAREVVDVAGRAVFGSDLRVPEIDARVGARSLDSLMKMMFDGFDRGS